MMQDLGQFFLQIGGAGRAVLILGALGLVLLTANAFLRALDREALRTAPAPIPERAPIELVPSGRRLTPMRHARILEHLQQVKRDLDMVSDATKAETAVGDAAMLYQVVSWLAPITEELLCEHVKIAPAMTIEEEAPKKPLNARYRGMAAGAFGREKPDGERAL